LTPVGMISHPRSASDVPSNIRSPGSSTPIPSDSGVKRTTNLKLSPIPQSPSYVLGSNEATPRPTREGIPVNASEQDIPLPSSSIVQARPASPAAVSSPVTSSSTSSTVPPTSAASPGVASAPGQANSDYFSLKRRGSTAGQSTPDDFGGWGRPGSIKGREGGVSSPQENVPTAPTTPGGGFMGRLKNLGKTTRRTATDIETPSATVSSSSTAADESDIEKTPLVPQQRTFAQRLRSQPFSPPSPAECPPLSIAPSTTIVITEETASGWNTIYRATVGDVGTDSEGLDELMPSWLLEYLFVNRTPPVPLMKVSFVLLPAPGRPGENEEQLPELLNTSQSKLSASRFLRVRKLACHVQEKLDKIALAKARTGPSRTNTPTPRASSEATSRTRTPPGTSKGGISSGSSVSLTQVANGESAAVANAPRSLDQQQAASPLPSPSGAHTPIRSRTPVSTPPQSPSHSLSAPMLSAQYQTQHPVPRVPSLPQTHARAEDLYEILCNDQVISPDMTLAAVRQYVWRQSGELVMHYRKKRQVRKTKSLRHMSPGDDGAITFGRRQNLVK